MTDTNKRIKLAGFDGLYTRNNRITLKIKLNGKTKYQPTGLEANKPNIKACVRKLAAIEQQQAMGTFDFEEHFPNSKQGKAKAKAEHIKKTTNTVGAVAEAWYSNWSNNNPAAKGRTITNHENIVRLHIGLIADSDIATIRLADLITWSQSLISTKTGEPLGVKRLQNVYSTVKAVFEYAYSRDYFEGSANPFTQFLAWDKVENKSAKRALLQQSIIQPDVPLTKKECETILSNGHQHVSETFINMVGFNLATGLRTGELFGLCWDRIDLKKKTVMIDQQMSEENFTDPKAGSTRLLALTNEAVKYLEKQKALTFFKKPLTYSFSYGKNNKLVTENRTCKFVFINERTNEPFMRSTDFSKQWYQLLTGVGVPTKGVDSERNRTPYIMRASFASRLLTHGATIEEVARELGNTPATCKTNYARIIPSEQRFDHDRKNKLLAGV